MVKLSSTVTYALNALVELARYPSDRISSRELARRHNMPERFLVQILSTLATSGILQSFAGVSGGYALSRPAQDITLLDVIESIEHSSKAESQTSPATLASSIRGPVENTLKQTRLAARVILNKLTIADLARQAEVSSVSSPHFADPLLASSEKCVEFG